MYDVWCMLYDVYDVWCMLYDVWCMMLANMYDDEWWTLKLYVWRCMITYDVACYHLGIRFAYMALYSDENVDFMVPCVDIGGYQI